MLLKKRHIPALLSDLSTTGTVYVPSEVEGTTRFAMWHDREVDLRLDLTNTKLPPKDLLFPATERMYRWQRVNGELTMETLHLPRGPFLVFGLRPCDMASIDRMDDVFLTKGYVDGFYQARRDAMVTAVIACTKPDETCFCESMGIDPNAAPSADIVMHDVGDAYMVEAQTEKGANALHLWNVFMTDEEPEAPAAEVHCELHTDMEGVMETLPDLYEDELWDEVSAPCLTCGTCTFVCPTCHCFDISQSRLEAEGERYRCWDSCMFTDYTLMAGNHNPRARKSQRVRQRFMHKLCYFEQRYGSPLCVGCGRCLKDCPAAVDITRVIDRVGEIRKERADA